MSSNSIPSIAKDAPLKIDEVSQLNEEIVSEKKGKLIFISGVIIALFILVATWAIFVFWLNNSNL
ncbi:hypothetical protein A2771_03125 [Candidatus Woesebacteria bacterium RIFCSPHIGHO2_01_FULL_38_26b]|uniref:Uncharacterized protein n=1 Tax=Candidatus Woesebacteria bacterium RIFCSPHIGHO2_01_FULL_38_26b TaxID=1802491 RepID=A0A1F7XY30_9BACT|nr:MAG: hypothetical protein A2771_03125 [Candidatus Woesebacteria bacterium RIFCSPHIGHO2_01_FULL_38_26b]